MKMYETLRTYRLIRKKSLFLQKLQSWTTFSHEQILQIFSQKWRNLLRSSICLLYIEITSIFSVVQVHSECRSQFQRKCSLGLNCLSIIPATAIKRAEHLGPGVWETIHPNRSPLIVFVNSKSGDNQGVRFMRRFKQLLNPAQVFDLSVAGPTLGLITYFYKHSLHNIFEIVIILSTNAQQRQSIDRVKTYRLTWLTKLSRTVRRNHILKLQTTNVKLQLFLYVKIFS